MHDVTSLCTQEENSADPYYTKEPENQLMKQCKDIASSAVAILLCWNICHIERHFGERPVPILFCSLSWVEMVDDIIHTVDEKLSATSAVTRKIHNTLPLL